MLLKQGRSHLGIAINTFHSLISFALYLPCLQHSFTNDGRAFPLRGLGNILEGHTLHFHLNVLEAEKYDSKRTYKGFDGYSPGVFTIGGLIAYLVKP